MKQPKFLEMVLKLEREPDFIRLAPRDLDLTPPIFLADSLAKVECTTDGALPPQPIQFDIVCNNPPRARVEHERRMNAQTGYPYELYYNVFQFLAPPTDEELAERIAITNAKRIKEDARIAGSADNLTLSVTLPISKDAHDCTIYCRLMGKEKMYHLHVYCKPQLLQTFICIN